MDTNKFITDIAKYVLKYAPKFNINVCSPIIAQAILESNHGTSELALNACNYFGLKYRHGRCPTASGIYYKNGSEQNPDGSYVTSPMQWMKFSNMELGVIGYFDFINISNYSNLKGVTDPKQYLQNIKADGYATSLKYVDNLMAVIEKYNLVRFDKEVKMSKIIAIDAGHGMGTSGKKCMKSLDPNQTREWYLNDKIADRLQELLSEYDCSTIRVDDTTGVKDIALAARVKTANDAKADVYVSIHHNAGLNGRSGGGTIVYYYSNNTERIAQARNLYNAIVEETGLKGNRSSTVIQNGFYVIKKTEMPAFLIENGFMDSPTDVPIILSSSHAEKTAQGILKFLVSEYHLMKKNGQTTPPKPNDDIYYPAYRDKKTTLVTALTALGINSTYPFRKKIASANGISGYCGTAAQNTQMYNMLVAGVLKKT